MELFEHPRRFAKNVPGPFYTTGRDGGGDCLACGTPEAEAPDLLAALEGDNYDTYFVRQPVTPDETERACRATEVCCVRALRYAGRNREVIARLGNSPEYCDLIADSTGVLIASVGAGGRVEPAFAAVIARQHLAQAESLPSGRPRAARHLVPSLA